MREMKERYTLIFGSTTKRANDKLDEILLTLNKEEIKSIHRGSNGNYVRMKNGDRYTALVAADHSRGHKGHYLIIDNKIMTDKNMSELYWGIIMPCLMEDNDPIFFE